jgi:hypothetical protein
MTLRSAVSGALDYSKAEIHSPSWWTRWRVLLNSMDKQLYVETQRDMYQYRLACLSVSALLGADISEPDKNARELFLDIHGSLRPWIPGLNSRERAEEMTKEYRETWIATYGWDPMDPDKVAEWEDTLRAEQDRREDEQKRAEEEQEEKEKIYKQRVQDIRNKRLAQQGRK